MSRNMWRSRAIPCSKICRIQGTIRRMTPLKHCRLPGPSLPPRRDGICARGRTRLSRFSRVFRTACRAAAGFVLLAVMVLGAQQEPARGQTDTESATYTVTFEGNWNTDSTPGGVAGGAHFTTLIGAVHNGDVTFWKPDDTATPGVERVAEEGLTGTFETEIANAGAAVRSRVRHDGTSATGRRTFEVEFSRSHPLFTLLSMIAPSPDWFVGVSGMSLLDGSDWLPSLPVDLFPYDAGTEEGEDFSLSNDPTSPWETITSLRGESKFSDTTPIARLSFTLKVDPPPPDSSPTEPPPDSPPVEAAGGCAVSGAADDRGPGGSGSGGAFGLLLGAFALLLAVSLKRRLAEDRTP